MEGNLNRRIEGLPSSQKTIEIGQIVAAQSKKGPEIFTVEAIGDGKVVLFKEGSIADQAFVHVSLERFMAGRIGRARIRDIVSPAKSVLDIAQMQGQRNGFAPRVILK